MTDLTVKVYTTPTCPWCKKAKKFLEENDIEYTEIDVSEDEEAREEMVDKTGQMGVPVIEIEKGEESSVIVGFDESELQEKLEIETE